MELNFEKICRVCLSEGVMMPIFKVNISKKLMACAAIQVGKYLDRIINENCGEFYYRFGKVMVYQNRSVISVQLNYT